MSRPTLLVLTLLVLWLIVLVPMIFRRVDEGAQVRSVRRFGRSMRLLNRRHSHALAAGYSPLYSADRERVSYVAPPIAGPRDELFVPGAGRRRPVPAGQEGQMNRTDLSDARRKMMARRRRSLTVLIGGSVLTLLLAFAVGGTLFALAATVFCLGLGGYVYFLRTQALRDRERRAWRADRVATRAPHEHEHYGNEEYAEEYFEEMPETMVRIDDDNIDLHNLDTMDLTGIYNEADYRDLRERRAS